MEVEGGTTQCQSDQSPDRVQVRSGSRKELDPPIPLVGSPLPSSTVRELRTRTRDGTTLVSLLDTDPIDPDVNPK